MPAGIRAGWSAQRPLSPNFSAKPWRSCSMVHRVRPDSGTARRTHSAEPHNQPRLAVTYRYILFAGKIKRHAGGVPRVSRCQATTPGGAPVPQSRCGCKRQRRRQSRFPAEPGNRSCSCAPLGQRHRQLRRGDRSRCSRPRPRGLANRTGRFAPAHTPPATGERLLPASHLGGAVPRSCSPKHITDRPREYAGSGFVWRGIGASHC